MINPEKGSRPWDKDRSGFVMGEGGWCFSFEEYEHAKKRNAKFMEKLKVMECQEMLSYN